MKRWIGLLLVFALCVGMIACAAAETPPEELLGEPLSEEEMRDIAALAEKLAPVDYFAKSFVSEDLTDGELLFLVYSIFGASEYGIVGVDSEWFTDYAQKYFGRAVTEVGDILCSCGAVCAYYGGWLDSIVMRLVDVFLAVPMTLMAVTVVAVFFFALPE